MEFKIGAHVRVAPDYPGDRTLQGATGNIIGLPNDAHREEYLIRLNSGITKKVHTEAQKIWVSAEWLEAVGEMTAEL